ncbi:MAG: hypothetical protein KDB07_06620 [Planctomycetes bacterium]|nr:hypothetical protein [Planctomycetota bacterium]
MTNKKPPLLGATLSMMLLLIGLSANGLMYAFYKVEACGNLISFLTFFLGILTAFLIVVFISFEDDELKENWGRDPAPLPTAIKALGRLLLFSYLVILVVAGKVTSAVIWALFLITMRLFRQRLDDIREKDKEREEQCKRDLYSTSTTTTKPPPTPPSKLN